MKWLSIKEHTPPKDGYYIVRLASNEENSGDFIYDGEWFANGQWIPYILNENWQRTHFIIPGPV
ncbi:MAG TPA: hypothetical protein VGJ00_10480 [Rhabdochlamydiaceae bacterium]|jgi:hypothetical protein